MAKKEFIMTKTLVATKEVLIATKKNDGKCRNLGYVASRWSSS